MLFESLKERVHAAKLAEAMD